MSLTVRGERRQARPPSGPLSTMPVTPKRMPFMGHIAELRRRLTVTIIVVAVFAVSGYFFADQMYAFLVKPLRTVLGDSPAVTLKLLEAMGIRFKLGLWGGIIAASPVIIWEALAFFLPALKPKERVWFLWTFVAAVVFVPCRGGFLLPSGPGAECGMACRAERRDAPVRADGGGPHHCGDVLHLGFRCRV